GTSWREAPVCAHLAVYRTAPRHVPVDLPDRPSISRAARPDRARRPTPSRAIDRPAPAAGFHGATGAGVTARGAGADIHPHREQPRGLHARSPDSTRLGRDHLVPVVLPP